MEITGICNAESLDIFLYRMFNSSRQYWHQCVFRYSWLYLTAHGRINSMTRILPTETTLVCWSDIVTCHWKKRKLHLDITNHIWVWMDDTPVQWFCWWQQCAYQAWRRVCMGDNQDSYIKSRFLGNQACKTHRERVVYDDYMFFNHTTN